MMVYQHFYGIPFELQMVCIAIFKFIFLECPGIIFLKFFCSKM